MMALLAWGLVSGVHPVVLALAAAAVLAPLPTAALVSIAAAWMRWPRTAPPLDSEAGVLVALAGELRAGASLRQAVAAVAGEHPALAEAARLAAIGRPMGEVAAAVELSLPTHGRPAAAALRLAHRVGGAPAALFDELAVQALDADEMRNELKAAVSPALLQGAVVGGIPALALIWMATTGRLVEVAGSGPVGAAMVTLGAGLVLLGSLTVAGLVWRAARWA